MRPLIVILVAACLTALIAQSASALVHYDEGRRTVLGITLLQDTKDPTMYYYIPPFPSVSVDADGRPEMLCLGFVDAKRNVSGGILHFLCEFKLPDEAVVLLQSALEKEAPGAKIAGAVPLLEPKGDDAVSFEVISAVLSDTAEGGFTRKLISSGHAPLTPGSKAAVAAVLNPNGATLLWETLQEPTSDISVAVNAYYEAAVDGYNAKITADVSTVYTHFSSVLNRQEGYKRRALQNIVDELVRKSVIKVEVTERAGLDIDTKSMQMITDLVTTRLIELMFDAETGLSKIPAKEVAVEHGQIPGRQTASWLSRTFGGGSGDQAYITDNQFVMKQREDIQTTTFYIDLTKRTTIRVPVHTAGNMGGIYESFKDDQRVFRVINLDDPSFEMRDVYFMVDNEYATAFQDTINFVSVSFRKQYPESHDVTEQLMFNPTDIKQGSTSKSVKYPRLGIEDSSWLDYEYRVNWSVRDRDPITIPTGKDQWLKGKDSTVALVPPFTKLAVGVEVDGTQDDFLANNVYHARVEMRWQLVGKQKSSFPATIRYSDGEPRKEFILYYDRETSPEYRVVWQQKSGNGRIDEPWQKIPAGSSEYEIFLPLPTFETADAGASDNAGASGDNPTVETEED
ncbi:MAG: hypothetical protein JW889_10425 [Verrucomicrobia bacterium]|nr:hypothetical protein [Verrucomicrobiota bacterium]